jgi:hypothetical protein
MIWRMVGRPINNPFAIALILPICLGFGLMLALRGWTDIQHDAALDERGRPATATVTAVNSKLVTVAFTTADGRSASARIRTAIAVGLGDRVQVRYDPADPSGNVADPAEAQAAFTRWFYLVSGAVVMLLALYGIWWHLQHGQFRPRQERAAYRGRQHDRRQRIERQRRRARK